MHGIFVGDVRLTSVIAVALFATLALAQHRWLPILAMLAWAFGFEFFFEAAELTVGNGDALGATHIVWEFAAGLVFVPLAWRAGARPYWPLLLASFGACALWMATGFHVNQHTMIGFDPAAEVLNEVAKLLWAAAYLVPLLGDEFFAELVGVDRRRSPR